MANESAKNILDYLSQRLPRYPYQKELDDDFVRELVEDFPRVCILNEIKAFRWYYADTSTPPLKHMRLALRRWIERASESRTGPSGRVQNRTRGGHTQVS